MDIQAYLKRINYQGGVTPTLETLRQLHHAHLHTIPFENLDIGLGRPIVLNEAALFDKIVIRRRGGFCYELNGLFAAMLRELGFDVTLLSAEVAREDGGYSPPFDHLTLMVKINGTAWLADVGFGASFLEPIPLDLNTPSPDPDFHVIHANGYAVLEERNSQGEWHPQNRFKLEAHTLAEYQSMCRYHQTSPESHFTQKRICTLATPDGHITLSDMRFITTSGNERQERLLDSQDEYNTILRERFGVVL